MMKRHWGVSLAFLFGVAPAALAQHATSQSCNGREPVGYLGISGIECDCTISAPGSGRRSSFRSEPRITSLEMDSRAGAVLKVGDVITRVNGEPITSPEGARELSEIDPGESVVITVRRNGQLLQYALTAQSVCPTDSRVLWTPTVPQGMAPPALAAPKLKTPVARTPKIAQPAIPAPGAGMPVSFGMGLSCSGDCSIDIWDKDGERRMTFSQAPEVYSIERGGPADRAGIRRGDIITHINGMRMDSEEGGRLFANVKAGSLVRFTVRRDGTARTVSVHAVSRYTASPKLAQTSQSIERARASLNELQRKQGEQLRKLERELRRGGDADRDAMLEAHREMVRAEREHNQQLVEIARALSQAETRMRAALADSMRMSCAAPMLAPPAANGRPAAGSRTLRYTGTLGESEIEVRGANPVSVVETNDEVTITTGGTIVKVKKSK